MTGTIFDIEHGSMVDGPGIRTTIFFKGCNLLCPWCHNPESQKSAPELMFFRELCRGCEKCRQVCQSTDGECVLCGRCVLYCPQNARKIVGKRYTSAEIMKEILMDAPFYQHQEGGVTFSGGECMLQIGFLEELMQCCRQQHIACAVDTAGNVPWKAFERILPYTDLFLYDVKAFSPDLHREWIGVTNELILNNLSRILKTSRVWIRIPIIPGFNDTVDEMQKIRAFLRPLPQPERIELLPYHAMGENKYPALGRNPVSFQVPNAEKMNILRDIFR